MDSLMMILMTQILLICETLMMIQNLLLEQGMVLDLMRKTVILDGDQDLVQEVVEEVVLVVEESARHLLQLNLPKFRQQVLLNVVGLLPILRQKRKASHRTMLAPRIPQVHKPAAAAAAAPQG